MITTIHSIPDNMVGFRATGTVTKENFDTVVMPAVDKVVKKYNELNYLMILDTDLKNFTLGGWWSDAMLGIKQFTKWNRVAIVSGSDGINKFTDIFSVIVPGEFRGFDPSHLEEAIHWVSGKK